jgi:hypothetical protein
MKARQHERKMDQDKRNPTPKPSPRSNATGIKEISTCVSCHEKGQEDILTE